MMRLPADRVFCGLVAVAAFEPDLSAVEAGDGKQVEVAFGVYALVRVAPHLVSERELLVRFRSNVGGLIVWG